MKKIVFCVALVILCCGLAFGQAQYKVLWSFAGAPTDGAWPVGSLVSDGAGNLYGTTFIGGDGSGSGCVGGCGTVFELSPNGAGGWTETILHNFCENYSGVNCPDGQAPQAGLVLDAAGNLYGTTVNGGGLPCLPASVAVRCSSCRRHPTWGDHGSMFRSTAFAP